MLKELQQLVKDQALVARSGVQFLDYGFRFDPDKSFTRSFVEISEGGHTVESWVLRAIETNRETPADGEELRPFVDAETKKPVLSEATYSVKLERALTAFNGMWLPAPFLKRKGTSFEQGPSNWARLRVIKLASPDDAGYTHRLTLAFDTEIDEKIGKSYVCPIVEDVTNQSVFELASGLGDNSWWLYQPWIKGWLSEALQGMKTKGQSQIPRRQDGEQPKCAHWSYYAVLLQGIEWCLQGNLGSARLPSMKFIDTIKAMPPPIDVDLVLDIGNSRTCGVLVETNRQDELNILERASVLELRDLSAPHLSYVEPFRSNIEFVKPNFGSTFWSNEGGRDSAFFWPSVMRTGPEASRLQGKSSGASEDTGLSSPKRYLWDEREKTQPWYFNDAENSKSDAETVFGGISMHVTQSGEPLDLAGRGARPALEPKFSKASLFTFFVAELLLQAITQVNAPAYRGKRGQPNVPRRLRRVVFTIPTATPLIERDRYQKRCKAASGLLWRAFGWDKPKPGVAKMPEINIAYDEATCTQIVYLFNEISDKFRRTASDFFSLMKGNSDARSLRVASIDIGGGTTDLMITTYEIEENGDALKPKQNFREGFRKAGDDILEAVIAQHVLKRLSFALGDAGVRNPDVFLNGIMPRPGRDALKNHLGRLFVTRVLVPIGLHLLSAYESSDMFGEVRDPIKFGEIPSGDPESLRRITEYFEEEARKEGATAFNLASVPFDIDFPALGSTISSAIGTELAGMCEVIYRFDCDVLLISGRPSRLPIMRDLILRFLPAPPSRIVFMHEYKVGRWYPFREGRLGTIEDPKTTVVVGALLCVLADNFSLVGFYLRTSGFTIESTANYIGHLLGDNTVQSVVFAKKGGKFPAESEALTFEGPMFLGFRQLDVKRWPGTPLYILELSDTGKIQATGNKDKMPWRVKFRRNEIEPDDVRQLASAPEAIEIAEIEDREGDDKNRTFLTLNLQTLRDKDGYWLDTGIIKS